MFMKCDVRSTTAVDAIQENLREKKMFTSTDCLCIYIKTYECLWLKKKIAVLAKKEMQLYTNPEQTKKKTLTDDIEGCNIQTENFFSSRFHLVNLI